MKPQVRPSNPPELDVPEPRLESVMVQAWERVELARCRRLFRRLVVWQLVLLLVRKLVLQLVLQLVLEMVARMQPVRLGARRGLECYRSARRPRESAQYRQQETH